MKVYVRLKDWTGNKNHPKHANLKEGDLYECIYHHGLTVREATPEEIAFFKAGGKNIKDMNTNSDNIKLEVGMRIEIMENAVMNAGVKKGEIYCISQVFDDGEKFSVKAKNANHEWHFNTSTIKLRQITLLGHPPIPIAVQCKSEEEWEFVKDKIEWDTTADFSLAISNKDSDGNICDCINIKDRSYCSKEWYLERDYKVISFEQWCKDNNYIFLSKPVKGKDGTDSLQSLMNGINHVCSYYESLYDKVPKRKNEMLVFGKYKVGDIVVSLKTVEGSRNEGDMFRVLSRSSTNTLHYSKSSCTIDGNSWRPATYLEQVAFKAGFTNIDMIPSTKSILESNPEIEYKYRYFGIDYPKTPQESFSKPTLKRKSKKKLSTSNIKSIQPIK